MSEIAFNPASPTVMHIDLNSCFASIEQQANPFLRGRPLAVAAYNSPNGCILAASVEAKKFGIKTGMRVKDGKALYPALLVREPDPSKYRYIHLEFRKLFKDYTHDFHPKSIDEFVLHMKGYPKLRESSMEGIALEIKSRIKKEIGDWLTVSVGIAPNRYLAKLASNLIKPDGLSTIDKDNFLQIYSSLRLTDLGYIKHRNAARLARFQIYSVTDFYEADIKRLKAAFHSINGYYWYLRLRGWEIDSVEFGRRTYGNSYSLPKPFETPYELSPILAKLVTKTCHRFRRAGYKVRGVHLSISYRDGDYWHKGAATTRHLFATHDIYKEAFKLLCESPHRKPVRNLAVSVFNLTEAKEIQLSLFEDEVKKQNLANFVDKTNKRWGDFVLTSGRLVSAKSAVPDRIAFGGVKELEEIVS